MTSPIMYIILDNILQDKYSVAKLNPTYEIRQKIIEIMQFNFHTKSKLYNIRDYIEKFKPNKIKKIIERLEVMEND